MEREKSVREKGIHYIDVGVSGGVESARTGACMMIGGDEEQFNKHKELFKHLSVPDGYGYMGTSGAGHYVKMVHNAIEYGMMSAIAEGLCLIDEKKKEFNTNLENVVSTYAHGSIIEGKLMSWLLKAWTEDKDLSKLPAVVPFGETEEEMHALIESGKAPVLKAADDSREETRDMPNLKGKVINALRQQFGGHNPNKK